MLTDYPVLVQGPYLVRTAEIKSDTIHVTGDWSNKTTVEVWAPKKVKHVTFNAVKLKVTKSKYGSLIGHLPTSKATVESVAAQLPPLTDWKVADGLPEIATDYDDSRWTGQLRITCAGMITNTG